MVTNGSTTDDVLAFSCGRNEAERVARCGACVSGNVFTLNHAVRLESFLYQIKAFSAFVFSTTSCPMLWTYVSVTWVWDPGRRVTLPVWF